VRALLNLGILLSVLPLFGQTNAGELRITVSDPHGLGVKSAVELISESNELHESLATDDSGILIAKRLPFGLYRIEIQLAGFAPISMPIEVRSAIPMEVPINLAIASVSDSVTVEAKETLIDPHRTNSMNEIGSQAIETRTTSLPGRSLQDLVSSEPGWVFEGNAVLHPRGAEYQTQFVVDGVPLTDDRSP